MAVTSAQIVDFLVANPGMSDAQIVTAMETYGVSPAQMAQAVGLNEGEVASRVAATVPPGQSITLGDTIVVPQYRTTGSGETQEIGPLETVYVSKTTGDPNYKAPVGSEYQQYGADGTFQRTGVTQKEQSFFGGLGQALTDPVVLAALAGGYGAGLFGGAGALGGAATAGATGLTAGEIAALTAGDLAIGGGGLGAFAPLTAAEIAGLTAADLAIGAGTPSALSGVGGLTAAGAGTGALSGGAATSLGGGASTTLGGAGSSLSGLTAGSSLSGLTAGSSLSGLTAGAGALTGANTLLGGAGLGTTLAGLGTGVATGLGGLTAAQLASLLSTGLTTGSGLLQQQTSREAAQAALQMINAETTAAKQGAQFRPIGMTTRFGTSQFVTDPVTGRLTSAGYTLDPQAKNAQDRLVKLAESGLQQAEGAQKAFEPLQTGAQSLFKLGQGYLAQKPEDVASNYLKSQLALLQPGRDVELANIETRLRNQGRLGLSVAQGGNLGAASPELQALYNARAQQEAQLAANAQQYGQQQVTFGAGLLGQGASAMGQYYGGQQASYAPFTTALGQVQGLEQLAQQPLQMGINLGQIGAQTGFDAGRLGLQGASQATTLATGPAATNNPYATLLGGLGASPTFGAAGVNALGRLFG